MDNPPGRQAETLGDLGLAGRAAAQLGTGRVKLSGSGGSMDGPVNATTAGTASICTLSP
jgi:hypothetical protein